MNKKRVLSILVLSVIVGVALFAAPLVCNNYSKGQGIRVLVNGSTVTITSTVSTERIAITSFTIKGKDYIRSLSKDILGPFESATATATTYGIQITANDVEVSAQTCE
jgi:hypothetical protein